MKRKIFAMMLMASVAMTACNTDDDDAPVADSTDNTTTSTDDEETTTTDPTATAEPGDIVFSDYEGEAASVDASLSEIDPQTMTVELNTAALSESETVIDAGAEGYEDFVENYLYDSDLGEWDTGVKTLNITYADGGVTCKYYNKKGKLKSTFTASKTLVDSDDATVTEADITIDGQHVTILASKKFKYVLSGTGSEGSSFRLYSDKKFILELSDVALTNDEGPAISIQKSWNADTDGKYKGKRGYIVIEGTNTLVDAEVGSYAVHTHPTTGLEDDDKGVIFSEGKLLISGSGTLNIEARGKNGIVSDDYVYAHAGTVVNIEPASDYDGIKTNDGITIGGGVWNISLSGEAPRGLNTDSLLVVMGGRTTVVSSGVGTSEKQAYGIKALRMIVEDGEVGVASSGAGSVGIRSEQLYVQGGGTVKVKSTGSYSTETSDGDALVVGTESTTLGEVYLNGGQLALAASGSESAVALRSYNVATLSAAWLTTYSTSNSVDTYAGFYAKGGALTATTPSTLTAPFGSAYTNTGSTVTYNGTAFE